MFENLDDPQKQALLMMAAGLLAPQDRRLGKGGQFAAALSQGMQGGLLGFNQARQAKRRDDVMGQEAELRKMQMADMQRGQQFNQALSQGYQPGGPIPYNDATGNEGPQGPVGMKPESFDLSAAMKIDPVRAWQMKQSMQKDTTPIAVAEGAALIDRNTGLPVFKNERREKPKYQEGDTREIKIGNFLVTQAYKGGNWNDIGKAPLWKPDAPEKGPAPPQGYQWGADGKSLQAIPGGPADTKAGEKAEALKKREQGALARADFVLSKVGESIAKVGPLSTGAIGQLTRNFGNSPAFNLNKTIDPIKANIGFAELQAMREASPTGGALGQVAVQELNMLQSVLGSLDTAQGQDELLKSLNGIHKHFTNWKRAVQQANQEQASGGAPGVMRFDAQGNPL